MKTRDQIRLDPILARQLANSPLHTTISGYTVQGNQPISLTNDVVIYELTVEKEGRIFISRYTKSFMDKDPARQPYSMEEPMFLELTQK